MKCYFCTGDAVMKRSTNRVLVCQNHLHHVYHHLNYKEEPWEVSFTFCREDHDFAFYFYPYDKTPSLEVVWFPLHILSGTTLYNGPIPPDLTPENPEPFVDRILSLKIFL